MEWGLYKAVNVSEECNMNCLFCPYPEKKESPSLEEVKKQINAAYKDKKGVILSGKEPLLSPYLITVLKELKRKEIACIIETNGVILSDENLVDVLHSFLWPNCVFDILIEGYTSDMHNFLVGKNSFKKVKKAILNLRARNISFYTHTVMLKPNYRYLDKIAIFALNEGSLYHRFIFPLPLGNADKNFDSMVPFASMVLPYLKKAIRILTTNHIDFHVEGLPFCFFYPNTKVVYSNIISLDYELPKVHSKQCEQCLLKNECDGFFEWYFTRKSEDDLFPVKK